MKFVLLLLCQVAYIWASGIYYDYQEPVISYLQPSYGYTHPRFAKRAEVQVLSADDMSVVGRITLVDTGAGTSITGEVWGLSPGYHGFHVHEKGDLGDMCKEAGSHFNPEEKNHGAPTDQDRHVGDLGNIDAGHDGVARVRIFDHMVRLNGGKYDVTNLAIVIHADPDDLGRGGFEDSKSTGHAGARVACGIIRPMKS